MFIRLNFIKTDGTIEPSVDIGYTHIRRMVRHHATSEHPAYTSISHTFNTDGQEICDRVKETREEILALIMENERGLKRALSEGR